MEDRRHGPTKNKMERRLGRLHARWLLAPAVVLGASPCNFPRDLSGISAISRLRVSPPWRRSCSTPSTCLAVRAACGNWGRAATHFVAGTYNHAKATVVSGDGIKLRRRAGLPGAVPPDAQTDGAGSDTAGVVTSRSLDLTGVFVDPFCAAIVRHRHWTRPRREQVPA